MELVIVKLSLLVVLWNIAAYFIRRFRGIQTNNLYCGLLGFSGSQPPDMNKIKILGLYNQSRGAHSCGIYYNGEIHKGIDKQSKFEDFVQGHTLVADPRGKTFIGHTRYATMGSHTEMNAHPFEFDYEDSSYSTGIIGAHNGKIENYDALCKTYSIDTSGIFVDSKAFIKLIGAQGPSVLNEYKGYAALLYVLKSDPNALYFYHGKSRLVEGGDEYEERPLFFLKQKEGIYFSSLSEALWAIRDKEEDIPFYCPYNQVVMVKGGIFYKKNRVFINRGDANVGINKKTNYYGNYHSNWSGACCNNLVRAKVTTQTQLNLPASTNKIFPLIFQESLPNKALEKTGYIYFHRGRFWHVIENVPKLMIGKFNIDKKGYILGDGDVRGNTYWFIKGIMMKDQKSYETFVLRRGTVNSPEYDTFYYQGRNCALVWSNYSKYPVTHLADESPSLPDDYRFKWYLNGKPAEGNTNIKFSRRQYKILDGILKSISSSDRNDKIFFLETDKAKEIDKWIDKGPVPSGVKIPTIPNEYPSTESTEDAEIIDDSATYPPSVKTLVKAFCHRIYESRDDFETDVPSTVVNAINSYLLDLIKETSSLVPDDESLERFRDEFINTMINDKVTINENMLDGMPEIDEYVFFAYTEEVGNDAHDYDEDPDDSIVDTYVEEHPYDNDAVDTDIQEEVFQNTFFQQGEEKKVNTGGGKIISLNNLSSPNSDESENEFDKETENMAAESTLRDSLESVDELRNFADSLTALPNSQLAQSAASTIYRTLDQLRTGLTDVFTKEGKEELVTKTNTIFSDY